MKYRLTLTASLLVSIGSPCIVSAQEQAADHIKQTLQLAQQGQVEAQLFVADAYYMGRHSFPQNDNHAE